ncbi:MAG: serine O-acetyltransferase, partial [Desulfocucumaceae bacterium]
IDHPGDSAIDLRHDQLPDPVSEAMNCMLLNIERLERRVRELEVLQATGKPAEPVLEVCEGVVKDRADI